MLPELLEIEKRLKEKQEKKKGNIFKQAFFKIKIKIINFDYSVFLLVAFCLLMFITAHEATHGVIFDEYGCQNITYSVKLDAFYTTADCSMLTEQALYDVTMVQSLTEAIQYPMGFIICLLVLIAIEKRKSS